MSVEPPRPEIELRRSGMFVDAPRPEIKLRRSGRLPAVLINTLLQQGARATTIQHQLLQQFPSFLKTQI